MQAATSSLLESTRVPIHQSPDARSLSITDVKKTLDKTVKASYLSKTYIYSTKNKQLFRSVEQKSIKARERSEKLLIF